MRYSFLPPRLARSHLLGHHVRLAVFPAEEAERVRGGAGAGEDLALGVEVEDRADLEVGGGEVDVVGLEVGLEAVEEFLPRAGGLGDRLSLLAGVGLAEAVGGVGEVAPRAGVVGALDLGVKLGGVAGLDGVDEVLGVGAAAVALERLDLLARLVVGAATAATA